MVLDVHTNADAGMYECMSGSTREMNLWEPAFAARRTQVDLL